MKRFLCFLFFLLTVSFVFNGDIVAQEINTPGGSVSKNKKSNQDKARDYYFSGNKKAKSGNYKGAIYDYTNAINLCPDYGDAYLGRALMKDNIEDYSGAIADYDKAINMNAKESNSDYDTQSLQIFMERASLKNYVGDYQGAIKDYDSVIELYPKYYQAYVSRADTKYMAQDYLGSLSDYNKALDINPSSHSEVFFKRGNSKYNLKRYEDAAEDYTEAIKRQPNYQKGYYQLIGSFILSDNMNEALETLEKYISLFDNPYVYIKDFQEWNDCLNRYKENSVINSIKINLKKLRLTM